MNIQATKTELIKIIIGIDSEQLLNRMKIWLSHQIKNDGTVLENKPPQPTGDSAFVKKDGFLVFTGVLEGDFENLLKDMRLSRDMNLL